MWHVTFACSFLCPDPSSYALSIGDANVHDRDDDDDDDDGRCHHHHYANSPQALMMILQLLGRTPCRGMKSFSTAPTPELDSLVRQPPAEHRPLLLPAFFSKLLSPRDIFQQFWPWRRPRTAGPLDHEKA